MHAWAHPPLSYMHTQSLLCLFLCLCRQAEVTRLREQLAALNTIPHPPDKDPPDESTIQTPQLLATPAKIATDVTSKLSSSLQSSPSHQSTTSVLPTLQVLWVTSLTNAYLSGIRDHPQHHQSTQLPPAPPTLLHLNHTTHSRLLGYKHKKHGWPFWTTSLMLLT